MSNHRIQKWAPGASEGITVAGGNGPGASSNQLNSPIDVFLDKSGNLFVVDRGNNRIQKFPAPVSLTCPPAITVNTDPGQCSAIVNNLDPTPKSENHPLNYTLSGATTGSGSGTVSGKTFNSGVTTVSYTSGDNVTNTCSFTVTVKDSEAPVITCPQSTTLPYHPESYQLAQLRASDNCGVKNVAFEITGATSRTGTGPDASGFLNSGINTITWSVEDFNGNKSTCSTTVTISAPETTTKLNIRVYPNPSKFFFFVTINSNQSKQPIIVNVFNIFGRIVERKTILAGQTMRVGESYTAGIYILEAVQNKQKEHKILVKL